MSSTATSPTAGKEYHWQWQGTDGLRSYSYAASNSAWNYTIMNGTDSDGAYTFSDSSTGQPFARRGNLYNFTAATLGSSLRSTSSYEQATDSICPRGWQLPSDSTDGRYWYNLFAFYGVNGSIDGVNRAREWPLQYLPTGIYHAVYGYVGDRTTEGRWWTNEFHNDSAINLWLGQGDAFDTEGGSPGRGYAQRC